MDFGECGAWQRAGVGGRTPADDANTTHPWPPSPVYKTSLESLETSDSNPYIYYNMKLQAIIKSGMSEVAEETVWGPTPGVPKWEQARPMQVNAHRVSSPPGTDSARPLTVKKFVTHTTCQDSLGLQEHETYLIMGQISDLWRVKSECVARGGVAPAAVGTQAWAPFPTPGQSLVSKFLLHLSTAVLGFRAALNEGVGCVL